VPAIFALDAHDGGGGGMLSLENNYKAKEAKNATMLRSTGAINDAIGDPAVAPDVLDSGAATGGDAACTPLIAAALMATTTNNTAPITTLLFNACCTYAIIAY
jgi:hypothetical protein